VLRGTVLDEETSADPEEAMRRLLLSLILLLVPAVLLAQTVPAQSAPVQPASVAAPGAAAPAKKNVVILVYEDVEALDVFGPFQVFTSASELGEAPAFQVYLAAEKPGPVQGHNGLVLRPDCTLADCPPADILIVAGGAGVMQAMNRPELLDWIRRSAQRADSVASVCVGAFLLARAGLLDGLAATTHQQGLGYLRQLAPKARVVDGQRLVDNGKILTSAGMTAGIDLSLHLVSRLLGPERAKATATWMEYAWSPRS
jgi:transcriptional regulator GlxA family with amidase domain